MQSESPDEPEAEYERGQIVAIEAWRARPPSVFSRTFGTIAAPLGWAVRVVVPTSAIAGALRGADWLARQTIGKPRAEDGDGTDEVPTAAPPLSELDRRAQQFIARSIAAGTVEGGATGVAGLPGMAIDIPALITLALRTVRGVGQAYGYNSVDEEERQFVLGVMAAAGANTPAEKQAALGLLLHLHVLVARTTFKSLATTAASKPLSKEAVIIAARRLAQQLGVNLTKRKMAQALPLIGAAVGAASNAAFIADVGQAAQRSYQARWLADRGRTITNGEGSDDER